MRIGIYLGRHRGSGGGIGVYSRSLASKAVDLLSRPGFELDELVLYADSGILDEILLGEIFNAEVLSARGRVFFDFPASSYFRRLPNGARCRVLVRLLPRCGAHHWNFLFDQIFVPLLAWWDGLGLLHCTANYGMLLRSRPSMITVHDLYQAFPPTLEGKMKEPRRRGLISAFYRGLFRVQFRNVAQVVADSRRVSVELHERYQLDRGRVSVIPLGLDSVFERYLQQRNSGTIDEEAELAWLAEQDLPESYILVLASSDPRKNLPVVLSIIQEWCLKNPSSNLPIVFNALDAVAQRQVKRALPGFGVRDNIRILSGVSLAARPVLFRHAMVLFHPTLAEGFGFPAMEALAVGTAVVGPELEHIDTQSEKRLYPCDAGDENSVRKAFLKALEDQQSKKDKKEKMAIEKGKTVRCMTNVVSDTFSLYKEVMHRFAGRN